MAENYFGATDTGRQRQNNEDAFIAEPVLKDRYIAACVIDGVGGYEGGEVAAAIARQSILDYFSVPSGSVLTMMQEALMDANDKIVREKQAQAAYHKMACVVTLALIEKGSNKFYYAHVGDTRLYLFRDGSLVKVTKDHSFVGFLEDSGRLDEASAMAHPKRNEINKALGFEAPVQNAADYIETGESPFLPGDLILICSDGLSDLIDKRTITSILHAGKGLNDKAKALIDAANNAGGKDNITVVLVQNDHTPVKQEATKPVKKNETTDKQASNVTEKQTASVPASPKRANGWLVLVSLLALIFLGGFLWQWYQNRSFRLKPVAGTRVFHPDSSASTIGKRLQDTINRTPAGFVDLDNAGLGDVLFLPDTFWIRKDSLHIKGAGNTILTADSAARQNAVIMVAPGVRYLLFDSLTIQDINLCVPDSIRSRVHFNQVRFENAGFNSYILLPDTLITKGWKEDNRKDAGIKKVKN
jgi:serine/threonine protein phosphatase PrpC